MKIRYWALAAVLIAVPAAAVAHEHGEGRGPGRPELDADGNLTLDAARAASAERLKVMDTQGLKEQDAFRKIQQLSMNNRKSMREIAQAILLTAQIDK